MPERLLLTDIDNTLFNWVDYFGPCFRAMMHALSNRTGLEEENLAAEFRELYRQYGTTEYSFVLQQLQLFEKYSDQERDGLIHLATVAFSRTRRRRLKAYKGVHSTLRWCREEGYRIGAVTNAPLFAAQAKLRRLGLATLFDGVVAWRGNPVPDDPLTAKHKGGSSRRGDLRAWTFGDEDRKPSTTPLELAMRNLGVGPDASWVVGDGVAGDIEPALAVGAHALWARYGLSFDSKNLQTVIQVTPGGAAAVTKAYEERELDGVPALSTFGEVRDLLPARRVTLF